MKAIGYHAAGAADVLVDVDVPAPQPGPRDLLVRVKAISINPADVKLRANANPSGASPRILGFDAAGIVEAVGSEVTLFQPGDEVYYAGDITRAGTYAELHLVDERIVGSKPATLDWAEAAALPLTAITAWELLFERLGVARDRQASTGTLLVIGGAGGVGSMLVQLARALTGLTVIASASRPQSRAWVESMGAHHVIDHSRPLDEELRRIGIAEVGLVALLSASEHYLPQLPAIVAPQGRIALIDDPAAFDIVPLKRKSITVAWEFMFTRSMFATADMIEQHRLLSEISRMVDMGLIRTTLTTRLSRIDADTLRTAHIMIEQGSSIGKIVLDGFEPS